MPKPLSFTAVLAIRFIFVSAMALPLILFCLFYGLPFFGYEGRFKAAENKEYERLNAFVIGDLNQAEAWLNQRVLEAQGFLSLPGVITADKYFSRFGLYTEVEYVPGMQNAIFATNAYVPIFSITGKKQIQIRLNPLETQDTNPQLTLSIALSTLNQRLHEDITDFKNMKSFIVFEGRQINLGTENLEFPQFGEVEFDPADKKSRKIISAIDGQKYLVQYGVLKSYPQFGAAAVSKLKDLNAARFMEIIMTGVSLAVSILFLTGLMIFVSMHALKPLLVLEQRMEKFKANFLVPPAVLIEGPAEVKEINSVFVSLAAEVERAEKNLTQNLLDARILKDTLSAVIHVLLANPKASALAEALNIIAKAYGDCYAVIILDRPDGSAIARDSTGGVTIFPQPEWKKLVDILEDPVWQAGESKIGFPLLAIEPQPATDSVIKHKGRRLGHLCVMRETRFADNERILHCGIVDSLAPILAVRFAQSHEEALRKEAESSLRESEARLRDFIDNSADMIYRTDENDILISINKSGLTLLGLSLLENCIGKPFSDFVLIPADRESMIARVKETGEIRDFEIILKKSDGLTAYCIESSRAVLGANGEFHGIQGMLKDISMRVENDRQIWKTNMELAEANFQLKQTQKLIVQQEKLASIGQLAAGVAHEINNPLGFLKSNHVMAGKYTDALINAWKDLAALYPDDAKSIAQRLETDDVINNLAQMDKESSDGFERIVRIVSNLKTFSRMDPEGSKEEYDLNAGIDSSLVMAWNEIKYVAEINKDYGEIPHILVNGNEINQVILNILVNSGQAILAQGRKEKGNINIQTRHKDGWVTCRISDDGPGIPEHIIQKVFDPFFTTKEPGKGTGLGLSISYDIIVNKHGGKLSVDSALGKGTTFEIQLPVSK